MRYMILVVLLAITGRGLYRDILCKKRFNVVAHGKFTSMPCSHCSNCTGCRVEGYGHMRVYCDYIHQGDESVTFSDGCPHFEDLNK